MASTAHAQLTDSTLRARTTVHVDSARVTVIADARDLRLAHALLAAAVANDTFPGLPRPIAPVTIAIAPDRAAFREWAGPGAPEWGAAVAIPDLHRIVMQGSFANTDAGDPLQVLRHELAHLALHEALGDLPPHWFDEGYASLAAGEWTRSTAFETSFGMAWRALPGADGMEAGFAGGAGLAQWTYALSHLAVAELEAIDRERGLTNFFRYWQAGGSYELAMRQAYGMTSDGFDSYWHRKVRARYGALAFVADLSVVFGLFGLLLGPLFWARRRRDRRRLEIMRQADLAQEEAARQSALEAMMALPGGDMSGPSSLDTVPGHP